MSDHDGPSALAMQIMNRIVGGPYPIFITADETGRLSEYERLVLSRAAERASLVWHSDPANPGTFRLDDH
jgi:EAL domain-containing protein (putative c-di-GMP-specific phosphodiesterase class I)